MSHSFAVDATTITLFGFALAALLTPLVRAAARRARIVAAAVISAGLVLPWTVHGPLNIALTFVWLVGLTNAVNMLDNMDGLATGISAVAAIFLAINFYQNHQTPEALMLGAFAGALLGFLIYNHHPASIFMGDCGSMFIGFFLAGSALLSDGGGRS